MAANHPGNLTDEVLVVWVQPYTQRAEALAQARAIVAECRRHGVHRVLADTSLIGERIDIVDRLLVGMNLGEVWPRDIRLALVCTELQMLPTMPFEHAASGRGAPVRVFTDRDEAMRWLQA